MFDQFNRKSAPTNQLKDHPFAQLFPMMDRESRQKLRNSIAENGQMEEIILQEGKVLDGRNRYEICLELGIEPKFFNWEQLPVRQRGASPFAYVMAHNFDRRDLSPSQRAAIAVEAIPYLEKEAAVRQKSTLKQNIMPLAPRGANGNEEVDQGSALCVEDDSMARGKAAAAAAKATGASTRSVERAQRVKNQSPAKFEAVKAGTTTLGQAEKDDAKERARIRILEESFTRIAAVCGDAYVLAAKQGEHLKSRKEVVAFAEMNDADMKKCAGLVSKGWSVSRAKKYKMTTLGRTHSIGDLCLRALLQGGTYSLDGMIVRGASFNIIVKQQNVVIAGEP